jgi:hypothetical protein
MNQRLSNMVAVRGSFVVGAHDPRSRNTWRPKYTQFYSRLRDTPGSRNYPRAYVVLHIEDNEMSRNFQNRIEQGDLK